MTTWTSFHTSCGTVDQKIDYRYIQFVFMVLMTSYVANPSASVCHYASPYIVQRIIQRPWCWKDRSWIFRLTGTQELHHFVSARSNWGSRTPGRSDGLTCESSTMSRAWLFLRVVRENHLTKSTHNCELIICSGHIMIFVGCFSNVRRGRQVCVCVHI